MSPDSFKGALVWQMGMSSHINGRVSHESSPRIFLEPDRDLFGTPLSGLKRISTGQWNQS